MKQIEHAFYNNIELCKGTLLEGKKGTKTRYCIVENIYYSEVSNTIYVCLNNGGITTIENIYNNYKILSSF